MIDAAAPGKSSRSTRGGLDDDVTAARALQVVSTFMSGILAIVLSQALGAPTKVLEPDLHRDYMRWTKESFAVLMVSITQWWSPTIVKVSGDASMKDQLYQVPDGSLRRNFPRRLIFMANHHLYTDWLYLWWVAYTKRMHGHLYIIMKESLKHLPIIGWSKKLYRVVFLSRRWEKDECMIRKVMSGLGNRQDPMWLMIFTERTNLSAVTRAKSALKDPTNWLYDCTIVYEGILDDGFGQDIYTLKSTFLEYKPPKAVNMHWRRFQVSSIPYHNDAAFSRWLTNRWREKDYMLEYFSKTGDFPDCALSDTMNMASGTVARKDCKYIATEAKNNGWQEFSGIFEPIITLSTVLSSVDLTEPIDGTLLQQLLARNGLSFRQTIDLEKVVMALRRSVVLQPQHMVSDRKVASTRQNKAPPPTR